MCILSIDVEDWYHILDVPDAPPPVVWESLPSRIEIGFHKLIEILAEKKITATFFFLGWIAERYPHLVVEADNYGHEIASHGYHHELVYKMKPVQFLEDAKRSKAILEDITGRPVYGFRASGFSLTKVTPWFFDRLIEADFYYDSSLFPAPRGHGGLKTIKRAPFMITDRPHPFYEFPLSVVDILGRPFYFFGGGYLRFYPYGIIRKMAVRILSEGRPVIFYLHPRELDPSHPRLKMSLIRSFKSYYNLKATERKLVNLISDFKITSYENYINEFLNGKIF